MNSQLAMEKKNQADRKYGRCVLCGSRVRGSENYLTAEEGYCHTKCLSESSQGTPA